MVSLSHVTWTQEGPTKPWYMSSSWGNKYSLVIETTNTKIVSENGRGKTTVAKIERGQGMKSGRIRIANNWYPLTDFLPPSVENSCARVFTTSQGLTLTWKPNPRLITTLFLVGGEHSYGRGEALGKNSEDKRLLSFSRSGDELDIPQKEWILVNLLLYLGEIP